MLLLDFLRSPEAYRAMGLQGEAVQTIETHHAWVFLFGEHALKLKKPVRGLGLAVVNRIAPARKFFMREAGGAVGDLPRLLRGEAL